MLINRPKLNQCAADNKLGATDLHNLIIDDLSNDSEAMQVNIL